ncbi:MAG TPA: hypothetical protein VE153_19270, partial [Myxococcus sp.]|nr:hypothetical protein [Myxococcus sp.]
RSRGTCAVPFESPAPLSFGPITRVAELALRITVRTLHHPYISVASWLFDAASGALHALPGASSSEGTETVMVADDGTHHVAWFEDGHGEVVDYAALLASQGEAGRMTVPAGEALAWAEAHGSAATVATALLLTRNEPARAAAQAVLARLPGWEAPVGRAVGVRAGSEARVLASLDGQPPTVSPEPWSLLVPVGARGDEVWALWDEDGDAAFDAALSVPRGALLSIEALQRLGALEASMSEQEVCPRGKDAGCSPYADAVNMALRQGTPSRAMRAALCGAERALLGRGFQRAELLEVIEVSCSRPVWTHPGQAGRLERPFEARCEEWKALCAP